MTDPEYYPDPNMGVVPPGGTLDTWPRHATDLRAAFDSLGVRAERIGSWEMDRIPHPAYLFQNVGGGETRTHFQGIQRLGNHPLLVVSGGDRRHSVSHLFLVECQPRTQWGPLGSNLWKDARTPPGADRLRRIVGLDRLRWHAGGVGVLGDVVAVPVEGSGKAQVLFLDLSAPATPRWTAATTTIKCRTSAAGAAALTRLPSGHFLCGIWRDERGNEAAGRVDFFLSDVAVVPGDRNTPFEHAWTPLGHWQYSRPNAEMPAKPHYQGISFVWDGNGPTLHMIGTRNTHVFAPNRPGEDWADLYVVDVATATAPMPAPVATYATSRRLYGADEFCSFAGGGGAFVSDGGALAIYGIFHYRGDGLFRMSEFWSPVCGAATWWVELYERADFEGRRFSILDPAEHRIDDYRECFAQGTAFDDTVESSRFRLPPGVTYRLFRNEGCLDDAQPGQVLDLVGTGNVVELPSLEAQQPGFGRRVRSSAARP